MNFVSVWQFFAGLDTLHPVQVRDESDVQVLIAGTVQNYAFYGIRLPDF